MTFGFVNFNIGLQLVIIIIIYYSSDNFLFGHINKILYFNEKTRYSKNVMLYKNKYKYTLAFKSLRSESFR